MRAIVFLKIELELDEDENAERVGEEISRQVLKMYGVRRAELSNVTTSE